MQRNIWSSFRGSCGTAAKWPWLIPVFGHRSTSAWLLTATLFTETDDADKAMISVLAGSSADAMPAHQLNRSVCPSTVVTAIAAVQGICHGEQCKWACLQLQLWWSDWHYVFVFEDVSAVLHCIALFFRYQHQDLSPRNPVFVHLFQLSMYEQLSKCSQ